MKKLILFFLILNYNLSIAQNISKIEYFIDVDPGFGAGTEVPINSNSPLITDFTVSIPNNILEGFHSLSVRTKDFNNNWSYTASRPFYKETLSSANSVPNITQIEYYIDSDPGYGSGISLTINEGSNIVKDFTILLPNSITEGFHYLNIRGKDANNNWSIIGVRPFFKETLPINGLNSEITMLEYFIDPDPGFGLASNVPITNGVVINKDFIVNLGSLPNGNHQLNFRGKNINNQWSLLGTKVFTIQNNIVTIGNIPTSWCINTTFNVPYNAYGEYSEGNIFTAILSDEAGNFTSPIPIGSINSTNSGVILASIPSTIALGAGHLIKIISSKPAINNNTYKNFGVTAICQCILNASLVTGNWTNSNIWSCGHAPLATEAVEIALGHVVTLNANGQAKSINLLGILNLNNFEIKLNGN